MNPTEDDTKFREEDNQPMRFANATLGKHRHVCAFFHGAEEEYRVLLPFVKEGLARGEMIRSAVVGQSSPGESPLRNTQHHFKRRLILLSVKCQRRGKMVRVQFPHPFDRSDKFWIILKRQPAFVDISNWRVDHD